MEHEECGDGLILRPISAAQLSPTLSIPPTHNACSVTTLAVLGSWVSTDIAVKCKSWSGTGSTLTSQFTRRCTTPSVTPGTVGSTAAPPSPCPSPTRGPTARISPDPCAPPARGCLRMGRPTARRLRDCGAHTPARLREPRNGPEEAAELPEGRSYTGPRAARAAGCR